MIIIHDFKIQLSKLYKERNAGSSKEKKDDEEEEMAFEEKIIFQTIKNILSEYYNNLLKNDEISIKVKIIKKSLDLRQKISKSVFLFTLDIISNNKNEQIIIDFLLKSGLKARIATEKEKGLYSYQNIENNVNFYNTNNSNNISNSSNNNNIIADSAINNNDGSNGSIKEPLTALPLEKIEKQSIWPLSDSFKKQKKPAVIIIGMGPAGIFAAVELLKNGIHTVIIEKGKKVENRQIDVDAFFKSGVFNPCSNVVFGEGGAGTFSDGKLTTRKKDYYVGYCMNFLVKMGADKNILTESRPHIGSDVLIEILKNIRKHLIDNGAELLFEEELDDIFISNNINIINKSAYNPSAANLKLDYIKTSKKIMKADYLILASGANNFKTYRMLFDKGLQMEQKPFAVGFRIEHKREFIDRILLKENKNSDIYNNMSINSGSAINKTLRYANNANANANNTNINNITGNNHSGSHYDNPKLTGIYYNLSSKNYGGYSFCMCPGGVVICSSSEDGHLCVNGMSYSGRNLENSNSAIVASVMPGDLPKKIDENKINNNNNNKYNGPLGLLNFRQDLEKNSFVAGGGSFSAPFQYTAEYIDDISKNYNFNKNFLNNIKNNKTEHNLYMPYPSYKPAVKHYELFKLLPEFINIKLAGTLTEFDEKFPGFIGNSILTGIEAGTSSAVRILRNNDYQSVNVEGIYPCGEGSGYSGGIVTSAIDGVKCAASIAEKIKNKN
ncbi:MAG: NAD(P)/FAD-dependent oxidoreductase [bacterium]